MLHLQNNNNVNLETIELSAQLIIGGSTRLINK